MKWKKLGLIYAPDGKLWWAKSYALIPTVDIIENDNIRIYFTSLDENMFGRIGYIEINLNYPEKILFMTKEPMLDIGELGTFDDSGVNASCIINFKSKKYLYYIGWQRAERVPYMLFSGLAISEDGGKSFKKYSKVPVLDRIPSEPFSRSAPFVFLEDNIFKAWYWSCLYWSYDKDIVYNRNEIHYNNVIFYSESKDGINWSTDNKICLNLNGKDEYSLGRPCVLKDKGIYKMWYSIRLKQKPYRIGYSESMDGIHWIRKDEESGIETSERGWDSEMICYPFVIDVKDKRYMFYNGNQHGKSGFGFAVLEDL